jgi:hypothetical protein
MPPDYSALGSLLAERDAFRSSNELPIDPNLKPVGYAPPVPPAPVAAAPAFNMETLDALHKGGHVDDATYGKLLAQVQTAPPPPAPAPPVGPINPENMDALHQAGRISDATYERWKAQNQAPAPTGTVEVGPITTINRPEAAPVAKAGTTQTSGAARAGGRDPRLVREDKQDILRDQVIAAEKRKGELDAEQSVETYDARKAAQDALDHHDVLAAADRVKEQADIAEQARTTRVAVEDYSKQKIDPDRFWHEKSTPQLISGAIAAMAAGIQSGLQGGPNQFLSMVERGIDRDLKAQNDALEAKGRGVAMQRGVLSDMVAITGSKEAARLAARSNMIEQAQRQLMTIGAKYKAPEIAEQVQQAVADLEGKKIQARGQVEDQVRKEGEAKAAAAAAQTRARLLQDRQYGLEVTDRRIAATNAQSNVTRAQADVVKAGNDKDSPQNRRAAMKADVLDGMTAFDSAAQNLPTLGTGELPSMTDASRKYDADITRVAAASRKPGDSSENDQKRLEKIAPQPGDSPEVIAHKRGLLKALLVAKHAIPDAVDDLAQEQNPNAAVGARPVK